MIHLQNVKSRQAKNAIFGIRSRRKSPVRKNRRDFLLENRSFTVERKRKNKGFVGMYHKKLELKNRSSCTCSYNPEDQWDLLTPRLMCDNQACDINTKRAAIRQMLPHQHQPHEIDDSYGNRCNHRRT